MIHACSPQKIRCHNARREVVPDERDPMADLTIPGAPEDVRIVDLSPGAVRVRVRVRGLGLAKLAKSAKLAILVIYE